MPENFFICLNAKFRRKLELDPAAENSSYLGGEKGDGGNIQKK